MTTLRSFTLVSTAALTTTLLVSCTTVAPDPVALQARCPSLKGASMAASAIGLPTNGARVDDAVWVAATTAAPAHCKVLGSIASRDAAAEPIKFQINLPVMWNRKALQYGGGGLNGVLITGMTPLRDAAPTDALPIARGYVTYGTDSGHAVASYPASEPGAFLLNAEMFENFAHASYKKVRDVAGEVVRMHYGQGPERVYYFGGSEGGREGLMMAQRYPLDYDGVISVVPVINWTGLFHAFVRNEVPQFTDWLDAGKVPMIAKAVNEACDALDGLADGVVNNYLACQARVDASKLRCAGGADAGATCLSDVELGILQSVHTPYNFSFPLANGVTAYPAWLWGHEDSMDGPAQSMVRWVTGSASPTVPPAPATAATQWLYGSNWIRYAIARNAQFDVRSYKPEAFQSRVQQTSALMDATDPDLSAFFARGGKLIIRENAADRAQSAAMGFAYWRMMVGKLGQVRVDQHARLWVSPASTHGGAARAVGTGTPVPTMADLLDPLDAWVTQGRAPSDTITQTSHAAQAPFALQASRPMCRYPMYPHYTGGDAKSAASYACRPSIP